MTEEVSKLNSDELYCFTTDLDWAPECAIEELLNFFDDKHIDLSVFVTHKSNEIFSRIKKKNIGIHPNFIQPSSHGKSIKEVVDYCQNLAPEADFFRCHRWFSCNDIYDELKKRGFVFESNLCMDMDVVHPFFHRSGMISFPVFFEDGAYVIYHENEMNDEAIRKRMGKKGLKVINIHPVHFAINTPNFKYTRDVKDQMSWEQFNNMKQRELEMFKYSGYGIRNGIECIVEDAIERNVKTITLRDAYSLYKERLIAYD